MPKNIDSSARTCLQQVYLAAMRDTAHAPTVVYVSQEFYDRLNKETGKFARFIGGDDEQPPKEKYLAFRSAKVKVLDTLQENDMVLA
jgi:hypothetical protein